MEIRAKAYWLTHEEGGRSHPIFSGYRPDCWFGLMLTGEEYRQLDPSHPHAHPLNRQWTGCEITFEGERQSAMPGEEGMILAKPNSDNIRDILEPGLEFEICEGLRVVGRATVLEVFG